MQHIKCATREGLIGHDRITQRVELKRWRAGGEQATDPTCDKCGEDSHKLLYNSKTKIWECPNCSDRKENPKGKMFGKLRPITAKERDHHTDKALKTKF